MPAQSPTLSPTLSAMVAALRGSSSGMPASTLPTRSAPTSAALVKMPPPTRMNRASSEAPKAKPIRTAVADVLEDEDDDGGPERGRGPRRACRSRRRCGRPPCRAAAMLAAPGRPRAVRTLPRTAMLMPMKPVRPEKAPRTGSRSPGRGRPAGRSGRREPSGRTTLVAVKKIRMARGMTMITMVSELAGQEGLGPLLDGPGDLPHLGVPWSAARTPRTSSKASDDADDAGEQGRCTAMSCRSAKVEGLVAALGCRRCDHSRCALSVPVRLVEEGMEAPSSVRCGSAQHHGIRCHRPAGPAGGRAPRSHPARRSAGGDVSDWSGAPDRAISTVCPDRRSRSRAAQGFRPGRVGAPRRQLVVGLSMAGRRPQSPPSPRPPGGRRARCPAILGRPWNTRSKPPVPSLSTHSRLDVPARGWTRTDLTRPATRTRCAPLTDAIGRGGAGPLRQGLVGRQHGTRSLRRRRRRPRRSTPVRASHRPATCRPPASHRRARAPLHRLGRTERTRSPSCPPR